MSQENKESKIKSNAPERKPAPSSSKIAGQKDDVLDGGERRLLWSARAFAILSALSVCLNVVMGVALAQLTPLVRVQPYLVNFQNKSEQIVTVTPINRSLEDSNRVTERLVRQYVMLRHTIVPKASEMERRWGVGSDLHYMSTNPIYKEFSSEEFRKGMDLLVSEGLSRGVEIGYVNILTSNSAWEVGFTTYDMYPQATEPKVKRWRAVVEVDYQPSRLSHRARFRNPLGFYVRRYSVSQDKG
jgi:type IV secretory pathway component VirB8